MGILKRKSTHSELGEIVYIKGIKYKNIRVLIRNANDIRVTLPFFCTFAKAEEFVEQNRERIIASIKRLKKSDITVKRVNDISKEELEEVKRKAKEVLPARLKTLSELMNSKYEIRNHLEEKIEDPFTYRKVTIKNNKSNWGSCSGMRNINLNMHLVSLPEELRDFVIVHELCHLVYPNHGKEFHRLLNMACNGRERELNKRLREYYLK